MEGYTLNGENQLQAQRVLLRQFLPYACFIVANGFDMGDDHR
jgi:hypothetical protein